MLHRRQFTRRAALVFPLLAAASCAAAGESPRSSSTSRTASEQPTGWLMPDEGAEHTGTWMAFGASARIWGSDLVPQVRKNLADIANAIVDVEPVTMLVRPSEQAIARSLLDPAVRILAMEIDDLWIRDTGAVFVTDRSALGGVDFHFNGWGNKQTHSNDRKVAAAVITDADAQPVSTRLTLEGGALEVDGQGTAIITESCVLNRNRNPGWTKTQVEEQLSSVLGVRKVIWLPGIAGHDITDGHTDFYARFTEPGHVVAALDDDPDSFDYDVTRTHLDILRTATDADGNPLKVTTLTAPTRLRVSEPGEDFAAGYINFYVCNGAVIGPQFGDPDTDQAAHDVLSEAFPDREIIQLDIDGIASGGGDIHCATQQQPVAR